MRDLTDYTSSYLQENFEDYLTVYRKKHLLERIENYKAARIMEIGCGTEPLFQYLDNVGYNYQKFIEVEPGDVFFNIAAKAASGNNRVECYKMLFSASEVLKVYNYDLVICSCLLHEVEDPQWFLKEMTKVCDEKTIVHVNTPNAYSLHRIIAKEMGLIEDVHSFSERNIQYQQHTVFDIDSLKELARGCGYEVIAEGSYFVKPFAHSQMFSMMKNGIIDEKVLDGLYNLARYIPGYGTEIYVELKLKE